MEWRWWVEVIGWVEGMVKAVVGGTGGGGGDEDGSGGGGGSGSVGDGDGSGDDGGFVVVM